MSAAQLASMSGVCTVHPLLMLVSCVCVCCVLTAHVCCLSLCLSACVAHLIRSIHLGLSAPCWLQVSSPWLAVLCIRHHFLMAWFHYSVGLCPTGIPFVCCAHVGALIRVCRGGVGLVNSRCTRVTYQSSSCNFFLVYSVMAKSHRDNRPLEEKES